jgi:hypothetical protein
MNKVLFKNTVDSSTLDTLSKMYILSIDVGIKNLACCILEVEKQSKKYSIIKWDVLDLCKSQNIHFKCHKSECKRKVYFKDINNQYYCNIHAKQCKYKIPTKEDKFTTLRKKKIKDIEHYISERIILFTELNSANTDANMKTNTKTKKPTKKELLERIEQYQQKYLLERITESKTKDFTLIDIGKNIVTQLNSFLSNIKLDIILIENQIGPLANKMKTIQGMIAQYFIMNSVYSIYFISASNKLKLFPGKKSNYKERKKMGIEVTRKFIEEAENKVFLSDQFEKHKKKDDLADCFLQGYWYIKENGFIE